MDRRNDSRPTTIKTKAASKTQSRLGVLGQVRQADKVSSKCSNRPSEVESMVGCAVIYWNYFSWRTDTVSDAVERTGLLPGVKLRATVEAELTVIVEPIVALMTVLVLLSAA